MPSIEKHKTIQHSPSSTKHISQATPKGEKQNVYKSAKPSFPIPQSSKRPYVRRTFDFYEDQIAYLTEESLKEKLSGKEGSMNSMVREAIDEWIKKRAARS